MSTTLSMKVAKMVWAKAGFRCSMPDCRKPLYFAKTEVDDHSLVGEMAHIAGEKPGSARWDDLLPLDKRNGYDNLILLCGHHHAVIDTQPGKYSVEMLAKIKREHADWVDAALSAALNQEPIGRPSLSLALFSPIEAATGIAVDTPPVEEDDLAALIANAIVSVEPIVPRSQIMAMPSYRRGTRSPFDIGVGPFQTRTGLYDRDIDDYEKEYQGFVAEVTDWAKAFISLGRTLGPLIAVDFNVGNFGNLAAGSVQVEATLTGAWRFMPHDFLEEAGIRIEPTKLFSEPYFPFVLDRSERRRDIFHPIAEPDVDLSSSELVWRCEELRQNKEHPLQAILVLTEPTAPAGKLSISATSATLTQTAHLEVDLTTSNQPTARRSSYVGDRLALIPTKYHQAIMAGLSGD